jgi:hypothetical protein
MELNGGGKRRVLKKALNRNPDERTPLEGGKELHDEEEAKQAAGAAPITLLLLLLFFIIPETDQSHAL